MFVRIIVRMGIVMVDGHGNDDDDDQNGYDDAGEVL